MPRPVRVLVLPLVSVALAVNCSVFPDEAVLISRGGSSSGGAAGELEGGRESGGSLATGGSSEGGGGAGEPPFSEGGASGRAGEGGEGPGGRGGAPGAGAPGQAGGVGEGGASGGAGGCTTPAVRAATLSADTWIEWEEKGAQHQDDPLLRVWGGQEESRALVRFSIPAYPEGTEVLKATLVLTVESNDDANRLARTFTLHELEQEFVATRTSWTHWNNGSNGRWDVEGGDFGPELASGGLPAGSTTGPVSFDVSARVRAVIASQPVPLSLIVLEAGQSPPAPAEVAFTSSEGDDSKQPALTLELCLP